MGEQSGDVRNEEDDVVSTGELKDVAGDVEKPKMVEPFGVQDNGEIANVTSVPVGKLLERQPQDLVGTAIKDIDEQGNLVAESGSTVGKAELKPKVLEKDKDDEGADSGVDIPVGLDFPRYVMHAEYSHQYRRMKMRHNSQISRVSKATKSTLMVIS